MRLGLVCCSMVNLLHTEVHDEEGITGDRCSHLDRPPRKTYPCGTYLGCVVLVGRRRYLHLPTCVLSDRET